MNESLVTVRTFRFSAEAELCRALLESEGITCFLYDDAVVQMDWFLGNAVGYVKLKVPANEATRATELLQQIPEGNSSTTSGDEDAPETTVCLSCQAAMPDGVDRCPVCGWSYSDDGDQ
ncbi:MAG: DUF2007 domain-containing protein [Pirellulales bacterium]